MDMATRAYLIGGFIVGMIVLAGVILGIGRVLQSGQSESDEFDVRGSRAARTRTRKKKARRSKTRQEKPAREKKPARENKPAREKKPAAKPASATRGISPVTGVAPVNPAMPGPAAAPAAAAPPVVPAPVSFPPTGPVPADSHDMPPTVTPRDPAARSPFGGEPEETTDW
jgi:hypothetical protein